MKGWYGDKMKHSLASRGIKVNSKVNSKEIENEQILNKVINNIQNINKILESEKIFATSGECGNFALALKNIFGGEVYCSYENESYAGEGEPAHCIVNIDGRWIDVVGEHDDGIEYLRMWAFNEAYPEDEEFIVIEWDSVVFGDAEELFVAIYDRETVNRIEEVIRGVLNE